MGSFMNITRIVIFCSLLVVGNLNAERMGYGTLSNVIEAKLPRLSYAISTIPARINHATHSISHFAISSACFWFANQGLKMLEKVYSEGPENPDAADPSRNKLLAIGNKLKYCASLAIIGTSTFATAATGAYCFYRAFKLPEIIAGHQVELLS